MSRSPRLGRVSVFGFCAAFASLSLACSDTDDDVGAPSDVPSGAGTGGTSAGEQPPAEDPLADEGVDSVGPSAGCGVGTAGTGEFTMDVDGRVGQYAVLVPPGYDPTRPYPLAFAFHGANRTHLDCFQPDCVGFVTQFNPDSILVFMRSFAAGWNDEAREPNVEFFTQMLGYMKAQYCVDQARVEVVGTSSGAGFTNILGCRLGNQLLSVGPIAGTAFEQENCVGRVAAVVVHGIDDNQVPFADGEAARDFYAERNGCSSTTVPPIAEVHAQVRAARDQAMPIAACADYEGCDEGYPVRWCEHSDGGYDNSTHGWPRMGGTLLHDFVSAL